MAQNQALPSPANQLVDKNGRVDPVWFQFFNSLWQRTGGGSNTGNIQSITVNGTDGILSNNSGSSEVITTLSLGEITPSSIITTGQITGGTGYFNQGLSNFGPMQFGTYTATTISNTGYLSITDITGTIRRIMIG
jgi:hypothetical protein